MWLTSWPGGQTAFDTEHEAETHAARIVREGTTTRVIVWFAGDEGDET